jgi:hypothetical protein
LGSSRPNNCFFFPSSALRRCSIGGCGRRPRGHTSRVRDRHVGHRHASIQGRHDVSTRVQAARRRARDAVTSASLQSWQPTESGFSAWTFIILSFSHKDIHHTLVLYPQCLSIRPSVHRRFEGSDFSSMRGPAWRLDSIVLRSVDICTRRPCCNMLRRQIAAYARRESAVECHWLSRAKPHECFRYASTVVNTLKPRM